MKYSWCTVLGLFQVYGKVIQLYMFFTIKPYFPFYIPDLVSGNF